MATAQPFAAPVARILWRVEPSDVPRWQSIPLKALRIGYVVARDLAEGHLNLHAMSLVYTTLLSLVPLLAISFSVLKAFGVHNQLEPLLLNTLAPLGAMANEITERVLGFVDNMKVGVLGAMGLGLLVYTAISVVQKIEVAFNELWRTNRTRPLARKFADYLSVLLIAPVLIFSAVGITASLQSTAIYQQVATFPLLGWLLANVGRIVPELIVIAVLTFAYAFIPNTKVRISCALIGAVVAGCLWIIAGTAFAEFAGSASSYTAIYSAFATAILFIIWLYVNWLIVLIGASIAFYVQHPAFVSLTEGPPTLSPRQGDRLTLAIMASIGRTYYHAAPAPSVEGLARQLEVAEMNVQSIIETLQTASLVTATANDPPTYIPARPLETMSIKDVLDAAHRRGEQRDAALPPKTAVENVECVETLIDRALADVLGASTVKDLALGSPSFLSQTSRRDSQDGSPSQQKPDLAQAPEPVKQE